MCTCLSYAPALLDLTLQTRDQSGALVTWQGSQAGLLFYFVLLVQLADVLQYGWGKLIGRHVIAPNINASRTWEGFCGGVASTTLFGVILYWVTPFGIWGSACMAMIIAVMGFAGGMTMSAIKRDRGVKDYGTLVQGHAGVLDRIDSLCFAAPVFFHLAPIRRPHGLTHRGTTLRVVTSATAAPLRVPWVPNQAPPVLNCLCAVCVWNLQPNGASGARPRPGEPSTINQRCVPGRPTCCRVLVVMAASPCVQVRSSRRRLYQPSLGLATTVGPVVVGGAAGSGNGTSVLALPRARPSETGALPGVVRARAESCCISASAGLP